MKFAVIKTGGKQYRVAEGETLNVEKLPLEESQECIFDEVLMIGNGGNVQVGQPFVTGAKVKATVIKQFRDDKVKVLKFKRRKHYLRINGHRQYLTQVKIEQIA